MPRRHSAYNGNYIVDACAKKVEDLVGTATTDSGQMNFNLLLKHVYDTMKGIKIPNPRSRDDVEKHVDGKLKITDDMTVDKMLDFYYGEGGKGLVEVKKPMAIMEFLKDNLHVNPAQKGQQQKKHFSVKPGRWNDKDKPKPCKWGSADYDKCVLQAVATNELEDLPQIPSEYEDNAWFAVRDEGLMCETDFYNPGIKHILANKKQYGKLLDKDKSKAVNGGKTVRGSSCRGEWGARRRRRGSARRGSTRRGSCRR